MKRRKDWFDFFDFLSGTNVTSGLPCKTTCHALCCPNGGKTVSKIGSFVIFLPFEYEYIKTRSQKQFDEKKIHCVEIDYYGSIIKAFWARDCPFLSGEFCSIYPFRPFDCRIFPLLVNESIAGPIFEFNLLCPEQGRLSTDHVRFYQEIIRNIYTDIPIGWWNLLSDIESNKI